jgi:glycosyltransferase involved in cell wall biosynthesis
MISVTTRIAVNGRFSGSKQPTGTQTAAFHSINSYLREARTLHFEVFADPEYPGVKDWELLPNVRLIPISFRSWSRAKSHFWEQFWFPLLCRKHGCRIAHHPMTTAPVCKLGAQTIVTVNDLNFYLHPEWYSRSFRLVYRFFAIPGIKRADRVTVISDYVLEQTAEHFHIPRERIRRIYLAVKPARSDESPQLAAKQFVLAVGSLQPHKNLARLIRAFQILRKEKPQLELWIIGRPQAGFQSQSELSDLLKSEGINLLGYVSESDLVAFYRQASVFCFPSLEEGFGMPILEAMSAGTVVVTSNSSCLPEIGGPVAEYVDPLSEASIAGGIRRMLELPIETRAIRVAAGRQWASQFNWPRTGKAFSELFSELAHS